MKRREENSLIGRLRPLQWTTKPKPPEEYQRDDAPAKHSRASSAPATESAQARVARRNTASGPISGGADARQHEEVGHYRVLHVGCGARGPEKLFPLFRSKLWHEVRLDIDPLVAPDVIASFTDMRTGVAADSFDAVWCSHALEHLNGHEVLPALKEFGRILKPTGFALIRTPDLRAIAERIVHEGAEVTVYNSPAGPITPLDMLFGHGRSIERGNAFMRHGTGFTDDRLGRLLTTAGFLEARTVRTQTLEVWGVGFRPRARVSEIVDKLITHGIDFQV